ncbi:MAG: gliding motility-associated ABC transporter ATP-binding subunit GldA [Flavobacteriales bacterium]|nr:gliding motility-associated ABC transporter ATP-binding subunit GldA [Flavobacteriales bacterium]|tara:strand:- start:4155 stop:5084 length:930 start_codon:yes stop_codon:yes gene_type:complete
MDIQISNLTKTFDTQKAVNDISFSVKQGEIVGFLGPNGAGKSTTMKLITGFLKLESGDISIDGGSIKKTSDVIKKNIGYLPEHNPLYLDMTVLDYLNYCGSLQKMSPLKIKSRTIEMIKVCGLNKEKHKFISELSKGYRQRVGIAQAMIHDPEILILDEPTTGLDPNQIIEIRKLIKSLGKEKTVILSTHILPEVEATCDRILIINNGQIVADGTAEDLKSGSTGQDTIKLRIDSKNIDDVKEQITTIPTVVSVDITNKETGIIMVKSTSNPNITKLIFELCVKNKWILHEMTPDQTKLEDIFRNLTLN